jgi:hypothetical protein
MERGINRAAQRVQRQHVQRLERQAWHLDDKVDAASMVQSTHHHNAFACTWMLRVLDQNEQPDRTRALLPARKN